MVCACARIYAEATQRCGGATGRSRELSPAGATHAQPCEFGAELGRAEARRRHTELIDALDAELRHTELALTEGHGLEAQTNLRCATNYGRRLLGSVGTAVVDLATQVQPAHGRATYGAEMEHTAWAEIDLRRAADVQVEIDGVEVETLEHEAVVAHRGLAGRGLLGRQLRSGEGGEAHELLLGELAPGIVERPLDDRLAHEGQEWRRHLEHEVSPADREVEQRVLERAEVTLELRVVERSRLQRDAEVMRRAPALQVGHLRVDVHVDIDPPVDEIEETEIDGGSPSATPRRLHHRRSGLRRLTERDGKLRAIHRDTLDRKRPVDPRHTVQRDTSSADAQRGCGDTHTVELHVGRVELEITGRSADEACLREAQPCDVELEVAEPQPELGELEARELAARRVSAVVELQLRGVEGAEARRELCACERRFGHEQRSDQSDDALSLHTEAQIDAPGLEWATKSELTELERELGRVEPAEGDVPLGAAARLRFAAWDVEIDRCRGELGSLAQGDVPTLEVPEERGEREQLGAKTFDAKAACVLRIDTTESVRVGDRHDVGGGGVVG
jgi:hypothetical protein